jgi:hypothetical protein
MNIINNSYFRTVLVALVTLPSVACMGISHSFTSKERAATLDMTPEAFVEKELTTTWPRPPSIRKSDSGFYFDVGYNSFTQEPVSLPQERFVLFCEAKGGTLSRVMNPAVAKAITDPQLEAKIDALGYDEFHFDRDHSLNALVDLERRQAALGRFICARNGMVLWVAVVDVGGESAKNSSGMYHIPFFIKAR